MTYKVVVISPSPFSRYTLATLYLLKRQNIEVTAVLSAKLLNFSRIRREVKRDGTRLLRKIYRKLILRSSENPPSGTNNIVAYMVEENMPYVSVLSYCKQHNIEYLATSNLNDSQSQGFLEKHSPDCIPFTGGGLIQQEIIDRAGKGVINCHMGVLPYYRGMDVVQWPILNKEFDMVGMTTHLMDKGVDTGDILKIVKVNPEGCQDLGSLRNAIERQMPETLVESCISLLKGKLHPKPQNHEDGIQHFILNKRLAPLVDQILQQQ